MPSNKKLLQAAAGNAGESLYVEDVFSTYLYEGNDANGATEQQISNGIDLSGEGGMVWMKSRDGGRSHCLYDTERGNGDFLASNTTAESFTNTSTPWRPTSTGFYTGRDYGGSENQNGESIASWTFRKAEKFFDVVTYTGNGVNGRQLPHNLGSTPGMVVCKRTDTGQNWILQHRSLDLSGNKTMYLNSTDALAVANDYWNSTHASDTAITLSGNADINASGGTYVAYVFAHNAGGFGDDGSENIISCGSYEGNGGSSLNSVTLGFEPQWILLKNADATGSWAMYDTMRGWAVSASNADDARLFANSSGAESLGNAFNPTATGFEFQSGNSTWNNSGNTFIYIAIRRPMKTPESGTEVLAIDTSTSGNNPTFDASFPPDFAYITDVSGAVNRMAHTRLLQGTTLKINATGAEETYTPAKFDYMEGYCDSLGVTGWYGWMFKRATGFMDVVAYTGSTSVYQKPHNLKVTPELMIVKNRGANETSWSVYTATTGADNRLQLNSTGASSATSDWDNVSDVGVAPTATHFNVKGASVIVNNASYNYIAYLFATLDGVSKVGSYTGTGADLNVDCGFSAGARFILIKRTDSTGDWYVWDSLRGIVAGNDPYLLLNTTAAQVTNTDYIDPLSSGFTVTSSAPAALNASGGTYIFLAIA